MIGSTLNNDLGRAGQAYREIKRRITELVYNPGDKLSEVRIANELGFGRSPVRTAFSRLQSEGWIEISPQSGTFVRGLSDTEITEILETRLVLESYLAGRAAKKITDAELANLRAAFVVFGERVASDKLDDYLELDLQFHLAIYKAAGNQLITGILTNLIDKICWIRRGSANSPNRIQDAFGEILAVLEALEARNEKAASAAMRKHIQSTLDFRKRGETSNGERPLHARQESQATLKKIARSRK
ncbi:DNA-binding GntR family transcriptional regulator [Nitrobacteraceae bacterium AZCC 1564]